MKIENGRGRSGVATVSEDGALSVRAQFDLSNTSAFGTLETAELTPVVQGDFTTGINVQLGAVTVANSATADAGGAGIAPFGRLRLQSGTNAAGSAIFKSRAPARYRAGEGMVARFTAAFTVGVAQSTQIAGAGNASNGYFFGFNGTAFGILHRNNATGAVVNTWISQTDWNCDKLDGLGASGMVINPTFGNVFMVKYPYLGYGDILFFVEDSDTGRFVLVHVIKYANTTALLQLGNPNLSFYVQSVNAGAVTNQIVYSGSYAIFVSGERSFVGNPKWAADNNKSAITAETSILGIRNATTYNGGENNGMIRLQSLAVGAASNSGVIVIRLRIGATLGGSPAYAAVKGTTANSGVTITAGDSVASVDTAATTATGGNMIYNITLANGANGGDSTVIDLTPFNLFVAPGEVLTVSGFSTVAAVIAVALNWAEDI